MMSGIAQAKGWHGIVPLHSACEDVKRILGVPTCERTAYHVGNETVEISFSRKSCIDGWNVPPGTVITIDVHPRLGSKLSDLHIDESKYKKITDKHVIGVVYYENAEEGITLTVFADGSLGSIFYGPEARDNYLRYPGSPADRPEMEGNPDGSVKFDEYGNVSLKEEALRLSDFAIQLEAQPTTQAYIIAYGGQRSRIGEAEGRAARAKNYLVSKRGIDRARIVAIDGGYREESTTDLFIKLKGGAAPIPSPTVCPSEVKIIKSGKVTNKRRQGGPLR